MEISLDLAVDAIIAGLLLGGFYAAVTVGVTISFGMLDIVNIAHPAFIMLGSFVVYAINSSLHLDPVLIGVAMMPVFFLVGMAVYQIYYYAFERRGEELIQGLAFFFGLLFVGEVMLILIFGVDYRFVEAPYIGPSLHFGFVELPLRMLIPFAVALVMVALLPVVSRPQLYRAGDPRSLAGPDGFAADGRRSEPGQAHRLWHFDRDRVSRRRALDHHPAGRAVGRPRLYWPDLCDLRARWHDELSRNGSGCDADRHCREHHLDLLRALLGAGGGLRLPATDLGGPSRRPPRPLTIVTKPRQ